MYQRGEKHCWFTLWRLGGNPDLELPFRKHGEVYSDKEKKSQCAAAVLNDFCFLAGNANGEEAAELIQNLTQILPKSLYIFAPQDELWAERIRSVFGKNCKETIRYATIKQTKNFDRTRVEQYVEGLPEEYVLSPMGKKEYLSSSHAAWSQEFCSAYTSYEDFSRNGKGIAALLDEEMVSGASAYSWYPGGIEIAIATKEDCRRKGLATACAAQLMLNCLNEGIYPNWDADNLLSLHLSNRLGYVFSHEYKAFYVRT